MKKSKSAYSHINKKNRLFRLTDKKISRTKNGPEPDIIEKGLTLQSKEEQSKHEN